MTAQAETEGELADTPLVTHTLIRVDEKQVLAVTLSVYYNDYLGRTILDDLKLCNFQAGTLLGTTVLTETQANALNGQSIRDVLVAVNNYLISPTNNAYGLNAGTWTFLITQLNIAFDNGNSVTPWAEIHLA